MNWSESLTNSLVRNGIIPGENAPLYQYGFEQGAFQLLNWIIMFSIFWAFGMLWEGILFMLSYRMLRVNAGGAHAKTRLRCAIYSTLLVIAGLLVIRYLPFTPQMESVLLVCSGCVIHALAPVEDENKPLDFTEIAHFGKKTRIILYAECGIWVLLQILHSAYSCCIVTAMFTLSVMLMIGAVKNLKAAPWKLA